MRNYAILGGSKRGSAYFATLHIGAYIYYICICFAKCARQYKCNDFRSPIYGQFSFSLFGILHYIAVFKASYTAVALNLVDYYTTYNDFHLLLLAVVKEFVFFFCPYYGLLLIRNNEEILAITRVWFFVVRCYIYGARIEDFSRDDRATGDESE